MSTEHQQGKLYTEKSVTAKNLYCPRDQSEMTPCICRDGILALTKDGKCVGCGKDMGELLVENTLRLANLLVNLQDAKADIPTREKARQKAYEHTKQINNPLPENPKNGTEYWAVEHVIDAVQSVMYKDWFKKWLGETRP